MARKGVKRASSLAKSGSGFAKKCKRISAAIRDAEDVPQPVRSMLCDNLARTFFTHKEERHAFQKSASDLVGTILKGTQGKLQAAIQAAQAAKEVVDKEAAAVSATNDAAVGASEAAAKVLADTKTAIADSKTALKSAKSALHDLEVEVKTAAADEKTATAKKEDLEKLSSDFIPQIKAGTTHGAAAGRHVTKELADSVEPEFLTCVTRTFSKAHSSWGTFDNIVDQRLDEMVKKLVAGLANDLATMESAKAPRAANIENAKGAIVAAEEKAKALEETCTGAAAAAKEADAGAKAATAALKQHQQHVKKAADALEEAEEALKAFTEGALAAYNEVEARAAPPPPAEPVAVEEPQASVQAAMAPAPAPAERARPSILSSPAVLLQQARNLLPSPRTQSSPHVQTS